MSSLWILLTDKYQREKSSHAREDSGLSVRIPKCSSGFRFSVSAPSFLSKSFVLRGESLCQRHVTRVTVPQGRKDTTYFRVVGLVVGSPTRALAHVLSMSWF